MGKSAESGASHQVTERLAFPLGKVARCCALVLHRDG